MSGANAALPELETLQHVVGRPALDRLGARLQDIQAAVHPVLGPIHLFDDTPRKCDNLFITGRRWPFYVFYDGFTYLHFSIGRCPVKPKCHSARLKIGFCLNQQIVFCIITKFKVHVWGIYCRI